MPTDIDFSLFNRRVTYLYDVFISYSSASEAQARDLYEQLSGDMAVFFAPKTLETLEFTPDQYVEVLSDSLKQSCQTLVLLSKRFLDSSWCQLELYGYLNLCNMEEARRLWIVPLEDGIDEEIGGQFVPLIYPLAQAVEGIKRYSRQAKIRPGERFAEGAPPKLFVDLPLYELYEPPSGGNRPPWGKDSRSPHGIPGAPPFAIYELMVREYMVQLSRHRRGKSANPFDDEQEEPMELSIPMQGLGDQYDYMSSAARRDAEHMLSLGYLGHSGASGGRLDGRYLFARSIQARSSGEDNWEYDLHDHFGRICMGQLEEIDRLEAAIERSPDSTHLDFYRIELAKAKYLAGDYDGALTVLEPLEIAHSAKLVQDACLARLCRLSDEQRKANAASDISVDRLRMESSMEDRKLLDSWAEGLIMAGYPP